MPEQVTVLLPVITIPIVVELMKKLGLPSKYAVWVVLSLALVVGGISFWNYTLASQIVGVLFYAFSSVGAYEYGKNVKDVVRNLSSGI